MVQELKDQFIETEPVEQQAFFWTAMYYYMAKEAIERHGLEGERVIRQAIRDYGRERGRRRRISFVVYKWRFEWRYEVSVRRREKRVDKRDPASFCYQMS